MADDNKNTPTDGGKNAGTPAKSGGGTGAGSGGGLLSSIIQNGKLIRDPSQVGNATDMITEFVNQVAAAPKGSIGNDVYSFIVSCISKIDSMISLQMDEIVHNPDFQQFEGSWRGLNKLVMATETSETLKLKLYVITKQELMDDLER